MNSLEEKNPSSILIVDDDPKYRLLLDTTLKKKGYKTRCASGGESAIAQLDSFQPDLILLDIVMPEMDGFEICRRLQQMPKLQDVPIIFLTAQDSQEDTIKAFALGAVDYITKPFSSAELTARVHTHLELKKQRDEILEMNYQLQREMQERKETERALNEKTAQLEQLNRTLDKRIKEEVEKRRKQEQFLMQQSKLAAMGEMVGAIAHQWRQPLSTVAFIIENILDDIENHELDENSTETTLNQAVEQIQYMSKTIDDFKTFFKPSKMKEDFDIVNTITETLSILRAELENKEITVTFQPGLSSLLTNGFPNEFKQVLINLLNNGKDAILERRKQGGIPRGESEICITVARGDNHAGIRVRDNGGGIPESARERVFEPYFTTKEQGLGIGLYMSKVIIEDHMDGKLYVGNTQPGTEFVLELPCW